MSGVKNNEFYGETKRCVFYLPNLVNLVLHPQTMQHVATQMPDSASAVDFIWNHSGLRRFYQLLTSIVNGSNLFPVAVKSATGFGLPYIHERTDALRSVFCMPALWWAVWRLFGAPSLVNGKSNSVQSATLLIGLNGGGSQVNHEERVMNKSNTTCKLTSNAPVRAVEAHLKDLEKFSDMFKDMVDISRKLFPGSCTLPPGEVAIAAYAVAEVSRETCLEKIEALKNTREDMMAGEVVELNLVKGAADG